ncbi:MAG: sulfatase-like hydrolase/transferase [Paracoccaceae bacterium]
MTHQSPHNLLVIVIDQFRADLLTGPLAAVADLPNLRRLAGQSLHFTDHHTVTVPCGPARASLLTGQYAMSHRSVYNGTPLSARTPNLATELRKLGRELLLFGYTDTQPDPTGLPDCDPAHLSYTGPIPGATEVVEMREEAWAWLAHLRGKGYDVPDTDAADFARLYKPVDGKLGSRALYRAEDSDTAYLTDRTLEQLDIRKSRPWSALLTYIRPHPPFVAPDPWHAMFDPAAMPAPTLPDYDHPFFEAFHSSPSGRDLFWDFDGRQNAMSADQIARCRATYLGLAAEVDYHIGRVLDWLDATGQADDTMLVLTADHGEMLGDLGIWGKTAPFRTASQVPLMIRAPGVAGGTVDTPTQSVDVTPTILSALGGEVPRQMQGQSLLNDAPAQGAVMVEVELGHPSGSGRFETTWDSASEACRAVAFERDGWRLVHFAGGQPPMLFDIAADAGCTQNHAPSMPERVAAMRADLLDWRMTKAAPLV